MDATDRITKNLGDLIEIACPCGKTVSWCFDCQPTDTVVCECGRSFDVIQTLFIRMRERGER